jgi:DNA-binding transcriptional ArsR family regulator
MLDATFAALADPTRRTIVGLLAENDRSVGELVDQFTMTQSAISRHLDVLEKARLIHRRREGQRRICSLRAEPLSELDAWMAHYRRHWQGALARLNKAVANKKKSS